MTETSEGGDKEEYNPVDVWLDSVGLPGLGSGEGWGGRVVLVPCWQPNSLIFFF